MVADPQLDPGPDLLDDAGSFIAEHDRHRHARPRAVGGVQAGVADAAGGHAHADLARARRLQLDVLDLQRRALLEQHRGSHSGPPKWGPRHGPQAPKRSERHGGAVALLD